MRFGEALRREELIALVRTAYERGIRTFLTADAYGEGEGDSVVGEALGLFPRDSYFLVGAVGHDFYTGKREGAKGFPRFTDPALRPESEFDPYLRMATEKSLDRCRTEYFDLLLLHNPDRSGFTSDAVWEAMDGIRRSGLAGALGVAPGPANGFVLDVIGCFERFGETIDWSMIILNPFEPWPGEMILPAARRHDVALITRVVDYGGIFHDDVKPGHGFVAGDHRGFRPEGWIENGCQQLEELRPIAEAHALTPLQLAAKWNLGQEGVEVIVPTLIREAGNSSGGGKTIESKLEELASMPADTFLTETEIATIRRIGDNTGTMPLKGASRQYQGEALGDQWPMTSGLEEVAARWGIDPDGALACADDPRDLRERTFSRGAIKAAVDRRLYMQLVALSGVENRGALAADLRIHETRAVLYGAIDDPSMVGLLIAAEDPADLAARLEEIRSRPPFSELGTNPELSMTGRTYATGHEPNLMEALFDRPLRTVNDPGSKWAVWYPLRRKPEFYSLGAIEQAAVLREHGAVGRRFVESGYAHDVRLECFGLDRHDNEFVIGLVGARLDWLSKLVKAMRHTRQTSRYIDRLGPFFVGHVLYQGAE